MISLTCHRLQVLKGVSPLDLTLGCFIWQANGSGMQVLRIFDVGLMLPRVFLLVISPRFAD